MKMKLFTLTAAVVFAVGTGYSQEAAPTTQVHVWQDPGTWTTGHFVYVPVGPRYTAQEGSFDLFATYLHNESKFSRIFRTNIRDDGAWGGGIGFNYFMTREIGVGIDANAPDNRGPFIDSVAASLIARWPFEQAGIAPYIFGGGGRASQPVWEWTGHFGVGLEYRWNPTTGVFIDGRYMWHNKNNSTDRLLLRTGFRFVF